jgi:hypothetical protein
MEIPALVLVDLQLLVIGNVYVSPAYIGVGVMRERRTCRKQQVISDVDG